MATTSRTKSVASKAASKSGGAGGKAGRMIYYFGAKKCDGDGTMKALLGGKGANLAQMTKIGLPVPPGFTITTQVCIDYYKNHKKFPKGLEDEVASAMKLMEKETGKKFGDPKNALLVSVRSGARDSMPGMMDTILNLGLNDETVKGLAAATGNPRFAYDSYRRFIQMYGDVVMGVQKRHENEHDPFEATMEGLKHQLGIHDDTDLGEEHLRELIKRYLKLIKERTGKGFPQDPFEQLMGAVGAVFGSWMNERAIIYRRKYKIPDEWGTAVNVQSMVFGNMGDDCATGVAFTR
ncbi:MAG: PEP/pyruvate-binding domain-containing protein, partial [Planctomycetaceae bacterium]